MIIEGEALVLGRDIDTDVIIPARYLTTHDPEELGAHCFEDLGPEIREKLRPGTIVIAGENFGCGSSREHAPLAIRGAGVRAVIASSFARIFLRNAINTGLPVFEVRGIDERVANGHVVRVDTETGEVVDVTTGERFAAAPIPRFLQEIIESGGLVAYAARRFAEGK